MEWYEKRPTDYRNDTWHLTLAEHGAYNLLLDHYYSSEAPLPDNDNALASICGCTLDEWLCVSNALRQFFVAKRGKLSHKNCDKIILKSYSKRSDGAKRVAKYRKNNKSVTRYTRVSNASTGQDRTVQNSSKNIDGQNKLLTVEFNEQFWPVYPRKVSRKTALKAYIAARKTAPIEDILKGLKAYVGEITKTGTDSSHTAHGATWLNQERWGDEYGDGPGDNGVRRVNGTGGNNAARGDIATAMQNIAQRRGWQGDPGAANDPRPRA